MSVSHNIINRLCNNHKLASPLTLQAFAFAALSQQQCCDQTPVCHGHATTSSSISSCLNSCRIFHTKSSHLELTLFRIEVTMLAIAFIGRSPHLFNAKHISHLDSLLPSVVTVMNSIFSRRYFEIRQL